MRIKILGVGGAINDGIPYNAFAINNSLLCEAPPDIMVSLNKQKVDYTKIETIFVSHFHADHCFGMPFLLLNQFYVMSKLKNKARLTIAGPSGIKMAVLSLVANAFGAKHPCVDWTKKTYRFIELDTTSHFKLLPGCQTRYFLMRHMVETYGFIILKKERPCFAYTSDTLWCNSVEKILEHKPRIVLIDLNGKRNDRVPVHLSRDEIVEFGLPITGTLTKYYGTHLRRNETSKLRNLVYAKTGMKIKI